MNSQKKFIRIERLKGKCLSNVCLRYRSLHRAVKNLDLESARTYGQVKAELARRGELLADNDLFIASLALSRNLTLVTHNTHHYERIANLCLDDWIAQTEFDIVHR